MNLATDPAFKGVVAAAYSARLQAGPSRVVAGAPPARCRAKVTSATTLTSSWPAAIVQTQWIDVVARRGLLAGETQRPPLYPHSGLRTPALR